MFKALVWLQLYHILYMLLLSKDLNGHFAEYTAGFEDICEAHGYRFKPTLQLPVFSCTGIPAGCLHSR